MGQKADLRHCLDHFQFCSIQDSRCTKTSLQASRDAMSTQWTRVGIRTTSILPSSNTSSMKGMTTDQNLGFVGGHGGNRKTIFNGDSRT